MTHSFFKKKFIFIVLFIKLKNNKYTYTETIIFKPYLMKNQINKDAYQKLFYNISSLYEKARLTFVKMYWHIGKYIVEVEQKNKLKGEYGEFLTTRLSKDLTEKYGKGFSKTNIHNMRLFYRTYSIDQISDRLEWSNYVTLLTVKDTEKRSSLEERVLNERLTYNQLRNIVLLEYSNKNKSNSHHKIGLEYNRGLLYAYSLIDPAKLACSDGVIVVDCGFNVWKSILVKYDEEFVNEKFITSKKNKASFNIKPATDITSYQIYTYKAYIEKIIDADTLWVIIDCGFYTFTRQKLRLRGIDAPELNIQEGKKAKRYVERVLKKSSFVIIKTYKSDKYDRYLSDIFYLPGEDDKEKVCNEGKFLNQELVDRELAVVV